MQANKTVNINGRQYDAVTGLPVSGAPAPKPAAPAPAKKPTATSKEASARATSATSVHATPQRSKTLHRRATKKPAPLAKKPQPGTHMDIARNKNVARFASHPVTTAPAKPAATPDIPAKTHPVAKRAAQKVAKKPVSVSPASPKQVKEAAIAKALSAPTTKQKVEKKSKKRTFQWTRRFTILTALFVVLISAGIITYFNLPHLSVALASAQSGVEAKYPEYVPDGFSLSQPVTYRDGQVTLQFTSNTGNGSYSISQENSSWDPSAVLENVVRKAAGDNYVLTQERGLKIYTYDGDAAWVTDEILYTIESDAPLSNDQIRRIATSL